MIFRSEERIAFARIISDLIEADFIVEEAEMEYFDKIKDDKDFKITIDMLSEAKTKTFAEAVGTLQKFNNEQKKALIQERLYGMSLSDGTCVPSEALLIMAVMYVLNGKGQAFSIPASSSYIENMKILYIENEDNTKTDAYIRKHYRAISNEFRLAGFDFVYIPQVAEDYRRIRGDYLHKVIKYMVPTLDEDKVENIQHELCSMTSSRFSHDLLNKKMGINMLKSKPAFLIKIGESAVADKCGVNDMERSLYSNFLLVPVDRIGDAAKNGESKTILEQVVDLMDIYRSMVSVNVNLKTQSLSRKFVYDGFHKSLFDLILYGKEHEDYKLVINLESRDKPLVLRPLNADVHNVADYGKDLVVDLTPQQYTLYILMVYMTLVEKTGLLWKDNSQAMCSPDKEALKKYNAIYKYIGKGIKTSCDYREKSQVSRIKSFMRAHAGIVANIDLFIPDKEIDGVDVYYKVPLPSDRVYVIEGPRGKKREVRLVDSDYWRSIF